MKKISYFLLLLTFSVFPFMSYSQNIPLTTIHDGGEFIINSYDSQNPEITPRQYENIEKRCEANFKLLGLDKIPKGNESALLEWPVKSATGFTDCGYYFIGAYVDQNTASGAIQDFNCGTNTYDGHHGTDIAPWPFSFYKMDNDQAEILAAAGGTVLDKHDGEFDRNCSSNSLPANYVIIQHTDGTRALYWHMKSGSVTTKSIGQTVSVGEYLGIVGSSGSSSGPHLHFEVWTGSTSSTYNDPFSGTCNTLNTNSWWAQQKPYSEPVVLKASVHTTDVVLSPCPETGVLNESTSYTIPFQGAGLAPGYAKFYIFLRDAAVGSTVNLKILKPDGTIFNNSSWTYSPVTYYKASYLGWSKLLPTVSGIYTFLTIYNSVTCSQNFTIINLSDIKDITSSSQFIVYPNPANGILNITAADIDNGNYKFVLRNLAGQILLEANISVENKSIQKTLTVSELSAGMYILTIETDKIKYIKKIIL